MFRRSLRVFVAVTLIGLVATVGYAVGRFRGPEEALAEAQQYFDRGEYQRCVDVLDHCEHSPSMQRDPTKRERLLRLRYTANSRLGNNQGALRDVEELIRAPGEHDEDLRLDHIRLLAQVGRGEEALQHARAFLKDHPDHWRGLELAGEACQTTYQDELRATIAAVELDVGTLASQAARTALLAHVYGPAGDPAVPQGLESLKRLYAAESRLFALWAPLVQKLEHLRARVQLSLQWWQQSLEAGGEPVAAFRGIAMSLDQAQRTDDLLILCESYRRRFTHEYVVEAGAIAAWALVRTGLDAAAIHTALRWMPAGSAKKLLEAGPVNPAVDDLLLARTLAAWRLRDRPELDRVLAETGVLWTGGAPVAGALSLAGMFGQYLRQDPKNAESSARWAMSVFVRRPVPLGQQDLLPDTVNLRVELMQARNAAPAEVVQVFTDWQKARPVDVEARLALARYHLATGKPAAALASIQEAKRLSPDDENVLAEHLATARVLYAASNQDGDGLLAECLQRRTTAPAEVPDPVCYILCAEAALKQQIPAIARASARAAVDELPWAIRPRLLEAEAELLGGRPEEAARLLRVLRERAPDDRAALQLAIAAHRKAGLPVGELVAAALRECPPGDTLRAELLRATAGDDPAAVGPFAAPVLPRTDLPAELRILAAAAMARLQRTGEAGQLLLPVAGASLTPAGRAELATAVGATLTATAATVDDTVLPVLASRTVGSFGLDDAASAPALLACARQLAASHPTTAYGLCTQALAAAAAEHRTGADFVLAGRLAQQLGRLRLAEEHWTAALAFADGRPAAESLARLCLGQDRAERALQVWRLVDTPSDAALALRCGDTARGEKLVKEALRKDGADLLAQAANTAIGTGSATADLVPAGEPQRQELLELVSLLHDPACASQALGRAEALAAANSESPTARLLLARALCGAGRGGDAAAIHEAALQKAETSPLLWREVALAAPTPGYTLSRKLEEALGLAVVQGNVGDSPVTIAFGSLRTADTIAAAGNQGIADQMRGPLWLRFPDLTRPTLADAAAVAQRGQLLDAWWMLDHLRTKLQGSERDDCVERMGALARQISALQPQYAALLYQAALRLLTDEGPHGRLVHFVLDSGEAAPAARLDTAHTVQLLTAHLQLAAAGRDQGQSLGRTVERLAAAQGAEAAVGTLDAALRAHPAALPVWLQRTLLLLRLQRASEGLDDLRHVLAHGTASAEQLQLIGLCARALTLAPADVESLATLPPALLESPAGRLARGLVALRLGKPDDAVALLTEAEPTADGLHLVALASALLQSRDPEALGRASQILTDLARDYPSSSLARYAGSFARQLAAR